jgi:predicted nucleic acid-binding protein
MNFGAIPQGTSVFIDANTFIYAFGPDLVYGPPSEQLLERIENKELEGFSSAHVLSDVAHRLMALEAITVLGWPPKGIAPRLKRHPADVQTLTRYRQAIDDISAIGVQILPVYGTQVSLAADVSRQFGLLSSDALIVSVMRQHGLTHLASLDADFDRIPGITRYAPI